MLLASVVGTAAAEPAGEPRQVIYVMRHLPPAAGEDPGLSPQGAALAHALARQLAGARLKAIFVTDTNRSRQTAAPIAARLRLSPRIYDPFKPEALAKAVAEVPGNVLVVGHSNTVPDLVSRFGGTPPAPLGHGDFGTVWKIDGKRTKTFKVKNR